MALVFGVQRLVPTYEHGWYKSIKSVSCNELHEGHLECSAWPCPSTQTQPRLASTPFHLPAFPPTPHPPPPHALFRFSDRKPSWNPPNWVFPVVWIPLKVLQSVAFASVITAAPSRQQLILPLLTFGIHLFLGNAWNVRGGECGVGAVGSRQQQSVN